MKASLPDRIFDALTDIGDWSPPERVINMLQDTDPKDVKRTLYRMAKDGRVELRNSTEPSTFRAVEKPQDKQDWWVWAASRLDMPDVPCTHCGGSGVKPFKPSRHGISRAVLGLKARTSHHGDWLHVSELIGNANLERLERVASLLGTDLDRAAKFCRELANRICQQETK